MKLNLFVPGRLCLFGEHTDWARKYRSMNADYLTQEDIRCAIQIREMITSVQVEGEKTNVEFNMEWWNEFNKELAKAILNLGR